MINGDNIRTLHHNRADQGPNVAETCFVVSASRENHAGQITDAIEAHGYKVKHAN